MADQIVLPVRIIMSPNSSSTCLTDGKARSATLRTISLLALPRVATVGARNSTPCPHRAPPATVATDAPPLRAAGRWYRGAIVWGRCRAARLTRRPLHARGARLLPLISLCAAAPVMSGCGAARQDVHERAG